MTETNPALAHVHASEIVRIIDGVETPIVMHPIGETIPCAECLAREAALAEKTASLQKLNDTLWAVVPLAVPNNTSPCDGIFAPHAAAKYVTDGLRRVVSELADALTPKVPEEAREAACAAVHPKHPHGNWGNPRQCDRVAAAIESAVEAERRQSYEQGWNDAYIVVDEATRGENARLGGNAALNALDKTRANRGKVIHDRAHPAAGEQEARAETCGWIFRYEFDLYTCHLNYGHGGMHSFGDKPAEQEARCNGRFESADDPCPDHPREPAPQEQPPPRPCSSFSTGLVMFKRNICADCGQPHHLHKEPR